MDNMNLESWVIDMSYGINNGTLLLAMCTYNGCIAIVNPLTFELISHINHSYDPIYSIDFNNDGEDIVTSSRSEIEIWKFTNKK